MHYNYFRDYEPGTGRYVQSNPLSLLGGCNPYLYTGTSPIKYTDIFGLQYDWENGVYYPIKIFDCEKSYKTWKEPGFTYNLSCAMATTASTKLARAKRQTTVLLYFL